MNIRNKISVIIATLTLIYGLYYWGIPKLINPENNIGLINKKIQNITGLNLEVTKPYVKMGIRPAIWLMAEDVSLLNPDKSCVVNLKHSALKIRLLPLIFGKIEIGNFSANNITVNLIYTKDSELKFGQFDITKFPAGKTKLNKAYFKINKYDINLKDLKQNKHLSLNGNYFILDKFESNKHLKFSTDATLSVNNKASQIMTDVDINLPLNKIIENQFKINGHIVDLDLADFSDYAKAFPQNEISSLSGKINILAQTSIINKNHKNIFIKIDADNLGIIKKENTRSISSTDKITLLGELNTINNGINIKSIELKSKELNAYLNGLINKLDSKKPNIDATLSIKNTRTEKLIKLLPDLENEIEDVNLYQLKKNPFYGNANGKIQFTGKITEPRVNGDLEFTDIYLNKRLAHNTPLATIKFHFKDTKNYVDVTVPAPINEAVYVKGSVDLYDTQETTDLYVSSTNNVDLEATQFVLNPLHKILNFDLGPVPIMKIYGLGNIDIHITGNRALPKIDGVFNFKNATASFIDIHNFTLTNGSGILNFYGDNISFKTNSATYFGKQVKIEGTSTLKGVMNFKVTALQQDIQNLINIVNTSPMLIDLQNLLKPIKSGNGKTDFILNLYGTITDINDIVLNKNIFAKGFLKLYSNNLKVENISITNISGIIDFDNFNSKLDLISNINNSVIKICGKLNENKANIEVSSEKSELKDIAKISNIKIPNEISNIHTSFWARYNGHTKTININDLDLKGKIYASKSKYFSIDNANFELINSTLKTSPIKGYFNNNPYYVNLKINNIFTNKQLINSTFNFPDFNIKYLNNLTEFIPDKYNVLSNYNGNITLKGEIKNNLLNTTLNPSNLTAIYKPQNIPVKLDKSTIYIKNNNINIDKMVLDICNLPININGKISNILKNPNIDISIETKPTQEFIEQIYNKDALYPIKIKGDIDFTSKLTGNINALKNNSKILLSNNASIYYMGATLGNTTSAIGNYQIILDSIAYTNAIKLNNLSYQKTDKSTPQLFANGTIKFIKNGELYFENLKIKTNEPTDAKIFNIVFRKPLMKEGIFTSDINLNGRSSNPKIIGKLQVSEITIPLFNTTINDILMNLTSDKIHIQSKGTIYTNNMIIDAELKNRFISPLIVDNMTVKLKNLNINEIVSAIREYEINNLTKHTISKAIPDINSILIKNANISADNIKVKELEATDFSSHLTLNDKMELKIDTYKFNMAEGKVSGSIKYNFLNNALNFIMQVDKTNAQIISETLFDLKGQIYGLITGKVNLNCNGKDHDACVQTLNGNAKFSVTDGKMPKLGSLEYLLKAGNVVKSGITGLTINGIIDLITPYKTGDFNEIKGDFTINKGIADKIEIYSSGKDLNIFITGTYNFTNMIAKLQIFGALTPNFATVFGKIANASFNTLFDSIGIISNNKSIMSDDIKKIPNIENGYSRLFNAEVFGDINGNDYVKSFKWLK